MVWEGSVGAVPRRVVPSSIVMLVVLSMAVAARAATPRDGAIANRQTAIRAARGLLGDVVLPAGAIEVSGETARGPLVPLVERLFLAAQVDRRAFWRTDASPSAVIDTVRRHLPADAKLTGSGSGVAPGSSSAFAVYTFPRADPAALGIRQLVVDAVEASRSSTVVRADGQVQYLAPRAADQRVPPRARALDVTMTPNAGKPLLSLTVTRLSLVRRIAALVNGLPFAGNLSGVGFSCPSFPSTPTDTFTFRASAAGRALAEVTELAATPTYIDPCETTTLRINGRLEPPLMEGGALLRRAGSLLHVKLTRS
jgi:hypothetical protein